MDLEGNLNYFDESSEKPTRVVKGHQKAITACGALSESKTLFTGSYEGRARFGTCPRPGPADIDGEMHSNSV